MIQTLSLATEQPGSGARARLELSPATCLCALLTVLVQSTELVEPGVGFQAIGQIQERIALLGLLLFGTEVLRSATSQQTRPAVTDTVAGSTAILLLLGRLFIARTLREQETMRFTFRVRRLVNVFRQV